MPQNLIFRSILLQPIKDGYSPEFRKRFTKSEEMLLGLLWLVTNIMNKWSFQNINRSGMIKPFSKRLKYCKIGRTFKIEDQPVISAW